MCEAMRWNHLPVAGGIGNQDPDLIAAFKVIFSVKSKYDAEQRRKQEAEAKRTKAQSARRGRRR